MTFQSYAQNYEDYLLWRVLGHVEHGYYVDVGANDPDYLSVSKAFALQDWHGIEIEPLPHLAERLRKKRPNSKIIESAVGAEESDGLLYQFEEQGDGMSTFDLEAAKSLRAKFDVDFSERNVPIRTLNSILEEADPDVIHWMKIDVEGFEEAALKGLDLSTWRPWVLLVEATAPGQADLVHHDWEPLILDQNYVFAFFDGLNRYYVAKEQAQLADQFCPVSILDDVASPTRRHLDELLAEANSGLAQAQARAHELQGSLNPRLEAVETRLASLDPRFDSLQERMTSLDPRLASLQEHMSSVDPRFDALNEQVGNLRTTAQNLAAETHSAVLSLHGELAAFRAHSERSLSRKIKDYVKRRGAKLSNSISKRMGARPSAAERHAQRSLGWRLQYRSKLLKAQLATSLLDRLPAPEDRPPSKTRRTLLRWASRGEQMRQQNALVAAHQPHAEAAPAPAPAAPVRAVPGDLSTDYSMPLQNWHKTLQDLKTHANSGAELGGKIVFMTPEGSVKTRGNSPVFSTKSQNYAEDSLSKKILEISDQDWLLFAQDGDIVDLSLCSSLARATFQKAEIVIPDMALVSSDRAYPLLAPGANYLHALNCDYFRGRFFARAGAVKKAYEQGAKTPEDIGLSLLRKAHFSATDNSAKALGFPVLEIDEPIEEFVRERAAVATRQSILLPTENGVIRSDDVAVEEMGGVSVLICTKDKGFYIRQLVARLLEYSDKIVKEIIIVSNNTENPHASETLKTYADCSRVKLVKYSNEYNFSVQNNIGSQHATAEFLLFLNDDIIPIAPRWLEELMAPFVNPKTGATGGLLLYPDERIQHAGMFLGHNGIAGHALAENKIPDEDFGFMASAPRFVTSVTGAVLLMRRNDFEKLGGFDRSLRHWIQDVDLCLRIGAAGRDVVFTPGSQLFHMESLSVKEGLRRPEVLAARARELEHYHRRWGARAKSDQFHPILLEPDKRDCRTFNLSRAADN